MCSRGSEPDPGNSVRLPWWTRPWSIFPTEEDQQVTEHLWGAHRTGLPDMPPASLQSTVCGRESPWQSEGGVRWWKGWPRLLWLLWDPDSCRRSRAAPCQVLLCKRKVRCQASAFPWGVNTDHSRAGLGEGINTIRGCCGRVGRSSTRRLGGVRNPVVWTKKTIWWFINNRSRFFSWHELFQELCHFTNKDFIPSVSVSLCWILSVLLYASTHAVRTPSTLQASAHRLRFIYGTLAHVSKLLIIASCCCQWTLYSALYLGICHILLWLNVCLSYLTLSSLGALMPPIFRVYRKPGAI